MNEHAHRNINWDGAMFLLVILVLWEISSRLLSIYAFPPISDVLNVIWQDRSVFVQESFATSRRAFIGFFIALVTMLPLGLMIGRIPVLSDLVEPLTEFLRPLPPIAVIPLAMMVLGIGDGAKLVIIVFGAAFPILVNTIDAVRVQDPMQSWVARSLKLSLWERMALIDLPAAMPRIISGIRLAITIALLLAIVAEMILSTDGLGDYLRKAQNSFSMARIIAGVVVIGLLSALVAFFANVVSIRLVGWHYRRAVAQH